MNPTLLQKLQAAAARELAPVGRTVPSPAAPSRPAGVLHPRTHP